MPKPIKTPREDLQRDIDTLIGVGMERSGHTPDLASLRIEPHPGMDAEWVCVRCGGQFSIKAGGVGFEGERYSFPTKCI
jgi:hypothetical protein